MVAGREVRGGKRAKSETLPLVERISGMTVRGTILAALLAVELSIVGEAVVAVRGGPYVPRAVAEAAGPRLIEGGPHRVFAPGAHPAVTVDIGYADLTIRTRDRPEIDISVAPSDDFGFMRATAPITATQDREAAHVESSGRRGWTTGDDRMVTLYVPSDTQVTVVNAGDIVADGLRAEASLNSIGSGSVTVEDYAAGTLHVASSRGRIVLHEIAATRLDATSDEGRVEGTALRVHDGNVESSSRVSLGFATGADTLVDAESGSGRITVSGFSASAVLAKRPASGDDASSRAVRIGAGNGHLDVHSSEGNITLAQEG